MMYPVIERIEQISKIIKNKPEITVREKEWGFVIDYAISTPTTFDSNDWLSKAYLRECRGIKFDLDGNIIARPFHKFFNIGEKDESSLENFIDLEEDCILVSTKLDGSMVHPIPFGESQFRMCTRAGITEIAEDSLRFLIESDNKGDTNYRSFIGKCLQKKITPIFEWCSPSNKVVLDYEPKLILTGMRYTVQGDYFEYNTMRLNAKAYKVPVVSAYYEEPNNLADEIANIKKLEKIEGYVLIDPYMNFAKMKTDWYVLRHKAKDSVQHEKNVLAMILEGVADDILGLLSESDRRALLEYEKEFFRLVDANCKIISTIFKYIDSKYDTRKEKAIEILNNFQDEPIFKSLLFKLLDGRSIREELMDVYRKKLALDTESTRNGSQTIVDSLREEGLIPLGSWQQFRNFQQFSLGSNTFLSS